MTLQQSKSRRLLSMVLAIPLVVGLSACGATGRTAVSSEASGSGTSGNTGGTTTTSTTSGTSTLSALPSSLVNALNSTDVSVTNVQQQSTAVPLSTAVSVVLSKAGASSTAHYAGLVDLKDTQDPAGTLAWAIEIIPANGFIPFSGPAPTGTGQSTSTTQVHSNYEVDFVNASTGQWMQAVQGYDSALGQ